MKYAMFFTAINRTSESFSLKVLNKYFEICENILKKQQAFLFIFSSKLFGFPLHLNLRKP